MRRTLMALAIALGLLAGAPAVAGDFYHLGHHALKRGDYARALKMLSFLAVNDDPRAQYDMGLFYRDGIAVEQNDIEALGWFLKAAEKGHMLAQYAAGLAFYSGKGSAPDPETAENYLVQASLQGHATAPLLIGKIHYAGEGVPRDYTRAYFWWTLADDRGAGGAKDNLALLDKVISEEEKAAAADLVARCRTITLKQCLSQM